METLRKKLESIKDKRKARKQASQGSPQFLESGSKSQDSQPGSNTKIKDHVKITAIEIPAAEGTREPLPNPTSAQADSRTQIQEPTKVNRLEIITSPEPTPISKPTSESKIVEITPSVTPTPTTPSVDINFNQQNLEAAQVELRAVSELFDANFHKVLTKNANLRTFDAEVKSALDASHSETNIQLSAKRFRQQLNKVIQLHSQNAELASHKWYSKVESFVLALYPAVRLTLGVTSDIAGSVGFLPLQVGANGLALIFQLLDQEKERKTRFLKTLGEIEVQSARLTSNKHFEAMFERILLQERATRLMIGIINYLNSALSYLCQDSIRSVVHSLFGASAQYQDAEEKLGDAIRRYSEALADFTAECVAADRELRIADMKERHDVEFVEWISSSQWDVESQLQALQDRYKESTIPTLQWAHKMDDFQMWLRSDITHECKERVLWVVGPPGVGKSTLAAYLLEFTRALDQDAITAFFFVKSDSGGLASPLKVVCTLAHQLSVLVPEFRQALEKLKRAGFVVKDELGIKFLFKNLLLDPLSACKRPIYVILDGIDEVDMKKDPRDPYRESSEILFDCLYSVPSSRLLFLSRPQSVPYPTTHSFAVKEIGLDQNKADIEVYVNHQLQKYSKLEKRFKKADIDPVQFFIKHSNGIFLWVVLVLKHLSEASGKVFNSFVLGISETPSDMTDIYRKILDRFSEEDREWIKEIFYWIIGTERQLSIDELQCAVEFCLQDEHYNFRDFVSRKCGSLFILTRHRDAKDSNVEFVQTVHETLRAFIMNPKCPGDLRVTTESAHTHITYRGLAFLSSDDIDYKPIYRYLVARWHYHLVNATLRNHDQDILCGLYRLFHSANLKKWVHDDIICHWGSEDTENETPIEKKALRDVHKWLTRYEVREGKTPSKDSDVLSNAIQWRNTAVRDIDKLGESVAKAAALIWLFDELESKNTIIAAFKLATGYYWTRENRGSLNDREELQELIDTDFVALIEWAGGFKRERLNERNLSIARVTLKQWEESYTLRMEMPVKSEKAMWEDIHEFHCPLHRRKSVPAVTSYSADSESTAKDWMILTSPIVEVVGSATTLEALQIQVQSDQTAWAPLGTAYRAAGDLNKAITAYKQAIKFRPDEFNTYQILAETYRVQREYKKSIRTLESCIQQGFDEEAFANFGWSYLHLDEKNAVEYFHKAMESNPHFAPAYKGLGDVYNVRGDHDTMIEIYRTKLKENPTTSFLWSGLGEAYLAKQMSPEAIEAYQTAVKVNPRDRWAWSCLGDAYRLHKQYDEAIDAFWTSIEGNPRDSWPWKGLAESYRRNGDVTRAIAIYTHALRRLRDYSMYISVGMLFREMGNYDMAIGSIEQAIERSPAKRRVLFAYLNLPTSHLFSNFPLISLDSNLPRFLLWTHLVECLRAYQDKDLLMHHDVELHVHEAAESPDRIVEEAIREYRKALQAPTHNSLLWMYSAYSASKGFPPFEQKCDLPPEVLWAMLAEAYKAASQYNEAADAYEEAVKLLPTNKWLRTSLSEMYEKVGDLERATEARVAAENVNGLYQRRVSFYGSQHGV